MKYRLSEHGLHYSSQCLHVARSRFSLPLNANTVIDHSQSHQLVTIMIRLHCGDIIQRTVIVKFSFTTGYCHRPSSSAELVDAPDANALSELSIDHRQTPSTRHEASCLVKKVE